jgi:hypothetical protein
VTDTGDVRMLLDDAAKAWPEVASRKQLLLRLAETGRDAIVREREARDRLREQQAAALERAAARLDAAALLDDAAWR